MGPYIFNHTSTYDTQMVGPEWHVQATSETDTPYCWLAYSFSNIQSIISPTDIVNQSEIMG